MLLRLAHGMLNDEEAARDIVHDIFASLLTSDVAEVTPAYLNRSVRNKCLSHLRNIATRDRLKALYVLDMTGYSQTMAKYSQTMNGYTPTMAGYSQTMTEYSSIMTGYSQTSQSDEDLLRRINEITNSCLSEQCRRVVSLRFTDGMSYEEISSALGISKVAVYKHLRHALDVLRQKLRQDG